MQTAYILELSLHNMTVGHLLGFQDGKNILTFSPEFYHNEARPTLSLWTHTNTQHQKDLFSKQWTHHHKLHPLLSNLLPEGGQRTLLTQHLKIHTNHEFPLLSYLGMDLPGALIARPIHLDETPSYISQHTHIKPCPSYNYLTQEQRFSLAGIQTKFSVKKNNDRYTITHGDTLGDWIVKPPSPIHPYLPQNEYTCMYLAALVGINIPDIDLIPTSSLGELPYTHNTQEQEAFVIKRFDRKENHRVHTEDFAQVLMKYPHEKYDGANYIQIAKIIYQYTNNPIEETQEYIRRLLVNILLANGDAHLKNWSLIYPDQYQPHLAPAYDIVNTQAYIHNEQKLALNLSKTKDWYIIHLEHFKYLCTKANIPWKPMEITIHETLERARTLWPQALKRAPMSIEHKENLKHHWKNLHQDIKIICS